MSEPQAIRNNSDDQAMADKPAGFHRTVAWLLKKLYLSLYQAVLLTALLVSIGAFVAASETSGTTRSMWLGVASSLLASSAFSALFLLFASQAEERFLRATVAQEMNEVATRVVAEVREQQRRYVPIWVYEERDNFSPRFNHDLTEDLTSTTRYVYYGLSGRYVGARLLGVPHKINDVLVVIGDPTAEAAIDTRRLHDGSGQGEQAILKELQTQVDHCIIGLFLARLGHVGIDLCVSPSPNYDRVEICDAAAYLTLFSTRDDRTKRYPETLRFSSDATFYAMMLRDANRAARAPGVRVLRLQTSSTHRDLARFYQEAFNRRLPQEQLAAMEARFEGFRADFAHQLREAETGRARNDLGATRRLLAGYRTARDRFRGR